MGIEAEISRLVAHCGTSRPL